LDKKLDGALFGAEDGLHPCAALPADRCHLDDAAVRINRHHRDDTDIGEVYMVERTISVHQDLPALAVNLLKLWHEPLEIAGWQGEQKPISRPIRWSIHALALGSLRLQGEARCDAVQRSKLEGGRCAAGRRAGLIVRASHEVWRLTIIALAASEK
jgi:hypothetical protein